MIPGVHKPSEDDLIDEIKELNAYHKRLQREVLREVLRLIDGFNFITEQFDKEHKAHIFASWILAGGDPRKIIRGQEEVPGACLKEER